MSESVAVDPNDVGGRLVPDLFGVVAIAMLSMALLVEVIGVGAAALVSIAALALAGLAVARLSGYVVLTASEIAYVSRPIRPPTDFGCGESGTLSMRQRMSRFPTTRIVAASGERMTIRNDISAVLDAMTTIGYEFVDQTDYTALQPKLVSTYRRVDTDG